MLLDPHDLPVPRLPAGYAGLRVAHVSDPHCRRPRRRYRRLVDELAETTFDLGLLTGDYMTRPGEEAYARDLVADLTARTRPVLGWFGVTGNHDSAELVATLASDFPTVCWLMNDAARVQTPAGPLDILGLSIHARRPPDATALVCRMADADPPFAAAADPRRPPRFLLAHFPEALLHAADLGVDLVFSGHTHGGQVRLPTGHLLKNSSTLPLSASTGLLRFGGVHGVVSRGLGEMALPFRLFCPPHTPLYTLKAADDVPRREKLEQVWGW